jgi:hypothetical protein
MTSICRYPCGAWQKPGKVNAAREQARQGAPLLALPR